jgi:hypothetical protein
MAMAMAKAKFAAPPRAGKVDDGAGSLLRSAGSATLSDREQVGTLAGAVTIAALSDLIEEIGPLDAPPGGRHDRHQLRLLVEDLRLRRKR